jgi:hypothetical protein
MKQYAKTVPGKVRSLLDEGTVFLPEIKEIGTEMPEPISFY